jgi:uncharacterized membrane protein YgcG
MNIKYILYALVVTLTTTAVSWGKLAGSSSNTGRPGSSWSSSGGGYYGGGGGHK